MMERPDCIETKSPEAGDAPSMVEVNIIADPKMDRRILLKTDAVVLVQLVAIATLEFLDKNSLAYSAILGLRTDTNLVGQLARLDILLWLHVGTPIVCLSRHTRASWPASRHLNSRVGSMSHVHGCMSQLCRPGNGAIFPGSI